MTYTYLIWDNIMLFHLNVLMYSNNLLLVRTAQLTFRKLNSFVCGSIAGTAGAGLGALLDCTAHLPCI